MIQGESTPADSQNKDSAPLVSVFMLTYQHAGYIAQALDGVLMQQTQFPIEICIGEDGSNDGTRDVCQKYADEYPEIIRLDCRDRSDPRREGYAAPFMFNMVETLNACRGKYIAICEGDDYWTDPLKLQKQVDFLDSHPDYVITYHDAKTIDAKGDLVIRDGRETDDVLMPSARADFSSDELKAGEQTIATLTVCFRNVFKSIGFPKEFRDVLNGDTALFSLLGNYGRGKYLGDSIAPARNRLHAGGVWSMKSRLEQQRMLAKTYHQIMKYYGRTGDSEMAYYFREKEFISLKALLCETVASGEKGELMRVYPRYCQICLRHCIGVMRLNGKVLLRLLFGVRV